MIVLCGCGMVCATLGHAAINTTGGPGINSQCFLMTSLASFSRPWNSDLPEVLTAWFHAPRRSFRLPTTARSPKEGCQAKNYEAGEGMMRCVRSELENNDGNSDSHGSTLSSIVLAVAPLVSGACAAWELANVKLGTALRRLK